MICTQLAATLGLVASVATLPQAHRTMRLLKLLSPGSDQIELVLGWNTGHSWFLQMLIFVAHPRSTDFSYSANLAGAWLSQLNLVRIYSSGSTSPENILHH